MILLHFTSIEQVDKLTREEELTYDVSNLVTNTIKNKVGYAPIFCIPCLNDVNDLLERLVLTSPTIPQRLIIFNSNEYDKVGYVSMGETIRTGVDNLVLNSNKVYNEYIVPRIELSNVIDIIDVSNSTFIDCVSGEMLDKLFSKDFTSNILRLCKLKQDSYIFDIDNLNPFAKAQFMYSVNNVISIERCTDETDITEFRRFIRIELIKDIAGIR